MDIAKDEVIVCGDPEIVVINRDLNSLDGCEVVLSQITIANYVEPDLEYLVSLREARSTLSIFRSYSLTSLEDLSNVEVVGGAFQLLELTEISDLSGLEKLRKVEGQFTLAMLPIQDLVPLRNLETTGPASLAALRNLTSLDGLQSLRLISGDLEVSVPTISRNEMAAFLQRVEVTGDITFNGEPW